MAPMYRTVCDGSQNDASRAASARDAVAPRRAGACRPVRSTCRRGSARSAPSASGSGISMTKTPGPWAGTGRPQTAGPSASSPTERRSEAAVASWVIGRWYRRAARAMVRPSCRVSVTRDPGPSPPRDRIRPRRPRGRWVVVGAVAGRAGRVIRAIPIVGGRAPGRRGTDRRGEPWVRGIGGPPTSPAPGVVAPGSARPGPPTPVTGAPSPAASRAGCRASKISRCIPSKTASSPPGDSRARLTSLTRSTPAGVIWTRVARRSRGCRARVTSPAVSSWSAVSFTVVGCIIRNRPRVLSRARPSPSSARVVSRK